MTRWYKFSEDTADIGTDSSGNAKDLRNIGGVTSTIDATYGKVAFLDGTSYFTLPSADIPSSMIGASSRSMSFWVKPDSLLATTGGLITYGNKVRNAETARRYALRYVISTSALGIAYFNTTGTATPSGSITADSWNHVTAFHRYGHLVSDIYRWVLSVSGVRNLNISGAYDLYIGVYGETGLEYFIGCTLDMTFYDGALHATATLSFYNAGPEVAPTLDGVI